MYKVEEIDENKVKVYIDDDNIRSEISCLYLFSHVRYYNNLDEEIFSECQPMYDDTGTLIDEWCYLESDYCYIITHKEIWNEIVNNIINVNIR